MKNVELFLSKSHVFVHSAKYEPFGMVFLEAMASSLPIISTNQGAIIESVIDGYNGYVVPSNSPNDIAEKIKLLLSRVKSHQGCSF